MKQCDSAGSWLARLSSRSYFGLFACVVMIAGALRLWQIASRPGYEWDEPVYTNIARNAVHLGTISLKPEYGTHGAPYLFHPPFYFLELGGWFSIVGSGITQARVLGAIVSLVALVALFFFLREVIGRVTLVVVALVAVDGWLVFTQRVSWIENSLLVLIFLSLMFYHRATERPTIANFVIAGFWLGATVMFKYLGLYVVVATLLTWGIQRRHNKQHLIMYHTVAATVAVYVAVMLLIFQRGAQNFFWGDSLVQFRRTFGLQESRGTIRSLRDLIVPLISQYRIFVGSMIIAAIAVGLLTWRLIQCARSRSFGPVRPNALLFSWALAGLVSFGSINLKFPHYFELLLIPLYAFVVSDVAATLRRRKLSRQDKRVRLRRTRRRRPRRDLLTPVVGMVTAAVVVLGLASFAWRIVGHHDNALKSVAQYAAAAIPRNDVVITEEPIGTIIPQPYVKMYHANEVAGLAKYIITYQSITEQIPDYPAFTAVLRHSTPIKVFRGFKEKLTVWRIDQQTPVRPAVVALRH